ncbi:hypothetical protein QQY66_49060 [Streptomyces sp. DG2A-72]|uniref:hypothetical protein n=1 Tax=Streptomyces sp. DG2A-72 TaxID=3051386 RepID=UPI00265BDA99|nr:hypothetical protein [Streptomyces sp. DG2A-72]MDO0939264.1 hypothetical protein [Streptomyces sp. DG2A-72]
MAQTLKIRKLHIDGTAVKCPDGEGVPREVTLIPSGAAVNATCGQRHKAPRGERQIGRRPQCFFQVDGLAASQLATIAQVDAGRPFRIRLAGDKKIEGVLVSVGQGGGSVAAQASAAANAKGGGSTKAGPAMPAGRSTGGAMAAAFGAVAAVAGAVGQTAAAAGQVATAGASAVGSVADLGREGVGAVRDGIREAGAYGERRHERKMAAPAGGGDED